MTRSCHGHTILLDHAYFENNWHVAAEAIRAEAPALVVHSGNLTFNAPARTEDFDHARMELDRQGLSWRVTIGSFWWIEAAGAWGIVGLNTALMASGRPEEAEQRDFLAAALASRGRRRAGRRAHAAVLDHAGGQRVHDVCDSIPLPAREPFFNICVPGGVKVIACGTAWSEIERAFVIDMKAWATRNQETTTMRSPLLLRCPTHNP